jgi:hypothetical protein
MKQEIAKRRARENLLQNSLKFCGMALEKTFLRGIDRSKKNYSKPPPTVTF